jgi:hypothetical protein
MRASDHARKLARDCATLTVTLFVLWPLGMFSLACSFVVWVVGGCGKRMEKVYSRVLTWILVDPTPRVFRERAEQDRLDKAARVFQEAEILRARQRERERKGLH